MLKVCVQSAPWYREDAPEESIKFIHECGFEGIDYNIDLHLRPEAIQKGDMTGFFSQKTEDIIRYYEPMKVALDKYGVEVVQMHAPFPMCMDGMDEFNEFVLQAIDKCCAVCEFLGCSKLIVHPKNCPLDYDQEKELNLDRYRRMIPSAKRYGVTICLENLFIHYKGRFTEAACSNASEFCWYVDALNAEAGETVFACCLDVGHAHLTKTNIYRYVKELGHRLVCLHIHDNTSALDAHMIPFTQDPNECVDWENFLEALRDIDYKGAISFETFRGLKTFPKEMYREALQLISAVGRYFRKCITV